jgi:hypothetical protein
MPKGLQPARSVESMTVKDRRACRPSAEMHRPMGFHPVDAATLPLLLSLPRHGAGLAPDKIAVVEVPGKGRGVVAVRALDEGESIEIAPVIAVDPAHAAALTSTVLDHYVYDWFPGSIGLAVALGCGSLYNHSYAPNAFYRKNFENNTIEYVALKPIPAGAEILVNYNGDPADQTPLWFDVVS